MPLDATRFDQHVSREALEWEHSVYLACFEPHDRPKLARLLRMQLVNRGFGRTNDGDVQYEVEGRRMSGDINTGLGNCLLMCGMLLRFRDIMRVKMRLANNGDDCLLVVERRDAHVFQQVAEFMLRYGFVVELEDPVDVLEKIDFCQTHPVFDGHNWIMVRDPRVCIDKDCCSVLDLGNQKGAMALRMLLAAAG